MTWKHLIVLLAALVSPCALMQSVSTLYAQQLFVGVNWHPHDVPLEQWKSDIAKMQEAGFNVVHTAIPTGDIWRMSETPCFKSMPCAIPTP